MNITLYVDGAVSGNPGPGGAAAILVATDHAGSVLKERELSWQLGKTTNQRAELEAVYRGLQHLTAPATLQIVTDSQYVIGAFTGNKIRANHDLIHAIQALIRDRQHTVTWVWIRGHNGHRENTRVDQLATAARNRAKSTARSP